MSARLLEVGDLTVRFMGARPTTALSDVSFDVDVGEVLVILGESGSGKSVTLRSLLRLHAPRTTRVDGTIVVEGRDVLALPGRDLRRYRGGTVAMVFQEPGLAFDPVYTIGDQIVEAIRAHEPVSRAAATERARALLERVRIPQAAARLDAWPHELSGGLKQRAMIALALACGPKLLLADEPTTALDAGVQMQILSLLRTLQQESGMAVIFVTHDIGAAIEVADRIAVMYAGRIVEENRVDALVESPRHPYTVGLLASTVGYDDRGHVLATIPGAPPDLSALPAGCAFAPRCSRAGPRCTAERPELVREGASAVACWHPMEADAFAA